MVQLRVGFEMVCNCLQPTPMIFNVRIHSSRASGVVTGGELVVDPPVPVTGFRDGHGNWCTRIVAPQGLTGVSSDAIVNDSGAPDVFVPEASRHLRRPDGRLP